MNIKRMRGRNHRGGSSGGGGGGGIRHQSGNIPLNRNHVFDSNGPDLRIRGTAQQLFEKYLQLGRDATSAGDRVMAESYFQHAEHYFRILGAMQAAQQPQQGHQGQGHQGAPQQGGQGQHNGQHYNQRRHQPEPAAEDGSSHEPEQARPGMGDQPPSEPREIPIAAAPPEA